MVRLLSETIIISVYTVHFHIYLDFIVILTLGHNCLVYWGEPASNLELEVVLKSNYMRLEP